MQLANIELVNFLLDKRTSFFTGNIAIKTGEILKVCFEGGMIDSYDSPSSFEQAFSGVLESAVIEVSTIPFIKLKTQASNMIQAIGKTIKNIGEFASVNCTGETPVSLSVYKFMSPIFNERTDADILKIVPAKPKSETVSAIAEKSAIDLATCTAAIKRLAIAGLVCIPLPDSLDFSDFRATKTRQNLVSENPFVSGPKPVFPLEKLITTNTPLELVIEKSELERPVALAQIRHLAKQGAITISGANGREFC
jgi:hypothetical protein